MILQTPDGYPLENTFKKVQETAHTDATGTFIDFGVSPKFLEELSSIEKRTRENFKVFSYMKKFNYLNIEAYGTNIPVKIMSLIFLTLGSLLVSKMFFDNFKTGFLFAVVIFLMYVICIEVIFPRKHEASFKKIFLEELQGNFGDNDFKNLELYMQVTDVYLSKLSFYPMPGSWLTLFFEGEELKTFEILKENFSGSLNEMLEAVKMFSASEVN